MAEKKKRADAVIIGYGWTGAIMAKTLTDAGLSVVALERGPARDTSPDFEYPRIIDELKYGVRGDLWQPLAKETVTVRHNLDEVAQPYRKYGSFVLGNGVGGAGVHWNGQLWRASPEDLNLRSHIEARYGKKFIPPDMTIQFRLPNGSRTSITLRKSAACPVPPPTYGAKSSLAGIRSRDLAAMTIRRRRYRLSMQRSFSKKQRRNWDTNPFPFRRRTAPLPTRILTVCGWGRATSAVSASALAASSTPRHRRRQRFCRSWKAAPIWKSARTPTSPKSCSITGARSQGVFSTSMKADVKLNSQPRWSFFL